MTDEEDVFLTVKEQIVETLPEVAPDRISRDASLSDLGADSMDRAEIAMQSMRRLGLKLRPTAFAGIANIGGLVSALASALRSA